jgi:hypothetical protein
MFMRRKKVACFKIRITAFRKIKYTLKMMKGKYQGSNDDADDGQEW